MIPAHSNVFVRNLPIGMDLDGLRDLFRPYGAIESVRILEPQQCGQQRLGFVKYCNVEDAKLAIERMSGARIEQYCLEVKLADADVGAKYKPGPGIDMKPMPGVSGLVSENDNLFVRGFPGYWGEEELADFFADAGIVVEARVLGCRDPTKGAAGLVRLSCVEEARHAIESFDGSIVDGCGPIRVQFADKKDEKEKFGLKTLTHGSMRATPSPTPTTPTGMFGLLNMAAGQYSDNEFGDFPAREFSFQDELRKEALVEGGLTTSAIERCVQKKLESLLQRFEVLQLDPKRTTSSVYVAKLPPDTDRLFLYEKFAPYGAISSVRVLYDENRKCTGVGFVNFLDPVCAKQAVMAMNGTRVAGRPLQVRLQETRTGKVEQR